MGVPHDTARPVSFLTFADPRFQQVRCYFFHLFCVCVCCSLRSFRVLSLIVCARTTNHDTFFQNKPHGWVVFWQRVSCVSGVCTHINDVSFASTCMMWSDCRIANLQSLHITHSLKYLCSFPYFFVFLCEWDASHIQSYHAHHLITLQTMTRSCVCFLFIQVSDMVAGLDYAFPDAPKIGEYRHSCNDKQ